jgi:hypothetical protein
MKEIIAVYFQNHINAQFVILKHVVHIVAIRPVVRMLKYGLKFCYAVSDNLSKFFHVHLLSELKEQK